MTATIKERKQKPHSKAVDNLRDEIADTINLLHLSHEAIICIDKQQKIVVFNNGAEKIFGYRNNEIVGQALNRLLPKRYHKEHAEQVERFMRGNKQAKLMAQREPITGLRKNGEEFTAHASISKFSYGGEITLTIVLHELAV